jgi:hypothetical protein
MSNPWEATKLFEKMLGEYTENGYRQGKQDERERIRAHITARIEELRSCNKDDDCAKIADYIESYLPEWVWE